MLQPISFPDPMAIARISARAERLLAEAERRMDRFSHSKQAQQIPGFVPSDYRLFDSCLQWILDCHLPTGRRFCEWGSGFGVAAMLAALQGFDACGIEVEAELVDQANSLATDQNIACQFVRGSVVPEAMEDSIRYLEDLAHVDTESPSGYEALGLEIDDFDMIYVFPWPGEHRFWEQLFGRYAADGALLLSYHGVESMRLHRNVRKRRRK